MNKKKPNANLLNPSLLHMGNYYIVCGNIIDDERKRFPDHSLIRSSMIEKIDFKENTVETRNTVYNVIGDLNVSNVEVVVE